MKIIDTLTDNQVTISCELFPPKEGTQIPQVKEVVQKIAALRPSFMSVTYGAGGGTSSHTVEIADEIQNKNNITALAHLTCYSSDRNQIDSVLSDLKKHNIKNILALRGDIPKDSAFPFPNQYHHASDLIEEIKQQGDFCIGAACYPEGHPESESLEQDIDQTKIKIDSGCEFLTTQMFFDNNILYSYLSRALKRGINVPVIAGIMPVTNSKQINRICQLSGTALPPRFKAIVERFGNNPAAMKQAGIAYATEQIIDLIANGIPNIHIYTMNKPEIAGQIMDNLSEIYKG